MNPEVEEPGSAASGRSCGLPVEYKYISWGGLQYRYISCGEDYNIGTFWGGRSILYGEDYNIATFLGGGLQYRYMFWVGGITI